MSSKNHTNVVKTISQAVLGLTLSVVPSLGTSDPCLGQLPLLERSQPDATGGTPVRPAPPPESPQTMPETSVTIPQVPAPSIPEIPAPASAELPVSAYILGGGDTIRIDILGVEQYSGDYQIPIDGRLILPLAGSISVQGLTLEEAADAISQAYANILKRPVISVNLQAPRPLNIWIAGEINRPGSYSVSLKGGVGQRPGTQYPTITQVIEQAGGIKLTADLRRIELRRPQRDGSQRTIDINLWQMLQTGDRRWDITLLDGDSIFIPTATTVDLGEIRQLANTSFAIPMAQARNVTVVGEVARPGPYIVLGGDTGADFNLGGLPTVTRAIQIAGGIKPLANLREIQLQRPTREGSAQIISVNLWQLLQTGDINQDPIVQDGDIIIVPATAEVNPAEAEQIATASFAPETINVRVVGEVTIPGTIRVQPNTPLNQALLAAGGFRNSRADRGGVELIRLNPNGTVSRQTVSVDLAASINEQTNPILRNNDIVVVNPSGITAFGDNLNNIFSATTSTGGFLRVLEFLGILKYLTVP